MKKREFSDYVQDILNSMEEVEEFTKGITHNEFVNDRKTVNAVIRSLEVLGEAAKKIPERIKTKYPQVPWKRMSGMRDKLIHEYFGVDLEKVWLVVKEELPPIKPFIQQLNDEIKGT
jgi:uncharacterized protein with HEPN domain